MRTFPTPADEADRLAATRALGLLDQGPEPRFDRLARIARRLFEVPMALITLVDAERVFHLAKAGVRADELPRAWSLCAHALLETGPFVVEDAAHDPRFAFARVVDDEPWVRFYAGLALRGPSGHRVGTICVMGHRPRPFGIDDRRLLSDLADLANEAIARTPRFQVTFGPAALTDLPAGG